MNGGEKMRNHRSKTREQRRYTATRWTLVSISALLILWGVFLAGLVHALEVSAW